MPCVSIRWNSFLDAKTRHVEKEVFRGHCENALKVLIGVLLKCNALHRESTQVETDKGEARKKLSGAKHFTRVHPELCFVHGTKNCTWLTGWLNP